MAADRGVSRMRAGLICALAMTLLGTVGTAPAALPNRGAGPSDVAKATRFLRGKRLSTHQSSGGGISGTIDRHYDFCAGARFRYESTFVNAALDELQQDVREGRWKVTRARLSRAGFGFARVPLVSDAGDRGALTVSASARGYFVDGLVAEVTRSPVCRGRKRR